RAMIPHWLPTRADFQRNGGGVGGSFRYCTGYNGTSRIRHSELSDEELQATDCTPTTSQQ
ncbi:hypothetical protein GBF38_001659, partial [Nibea albiflora]